MTRTLHFDADVLLYKVGFAAGEDEPLSFRLSTMKNAIAKKLEQCDADRVVLHLSGVNNFRDDVATLQPYKGNRKEARKPLYFQEMKDYLLSGGKVDEDGNPAWDVVYEDGVEADDTVGIAMTSPLDEGEEVVMYSEDKDLNMIPCQRLCPKTGTLITYNQGTCTNSFIEQLLTGDATDNIPGLYKLTKRKATKKLKESALALPTFAEKWDKVFSIYLEELKKQYPLRDIGELENVVSAWLHEIGTLLWIQQWDKPTWMDGYLADQPVEKEEAPTATEVSNIQGAWVHDEYEGFITKMLDTGTVTWR